MIQALMGCVYIRFIIIAGTQFIAWLPTVFYFQQILPSAYEYVVCEFIGPGKAGGTNLNKDQFKASFYLKLRNKLEVKFWIKDFEKISALKWQVSRTYVGCGSKGTESVYQVSSVHVFIKKIIRFSGFWHCEVCLYVCLYLYSCVLLTISYFSALSSSKHSW